jgi:hypothetical protein
VSEIVELGRHRRRAAAGALPEAGAMLRRLRERGIPPEAEISIEPDHWSGWRIEVTPRDWAEAGYLQVYPGVLTDGDVLEPDRAGAWSLAESCPGFSGPVGVYREADVPEAVWQWGWRGRGPTDTSPEAAFGWLKEHDLREPWFAQRDAEEREQVRREQTERLSTWLLERFPELRAHYSEEQMTERVGLLVDDGLWAPRGEG